MREVTARRPLRRAAFWTQKRAARRPGSLTKSQRLSTERKGTCVAVSSARCAHVAHHQSPVTGQKRAEPPTLPKQRAHTQRGSTSLVYNIPLDKGPVLQP